MSRRSFFAQFLKHSSQVGSVMPSSPFLIRKMMPATLPWHKMRRIAELGPGTGIFTEYIDRCRSAQSQLVLFEKNEQFRNDLQLRFPELPVYDDALLLRNIVEQTGEKFDLIISGLPFANFPFELTERLFRVIGDALTNGGTFVAFQYTLLQKKHFANHFNAIETGHTWLNVPPAWVFKCKKM